VKQLQAAVFYSQEMFNQFQLFSMLEAHCRLRCSIVACIKYLKSSSCRISPIDGDSNMFCGMGNSLRSASENIIYSTSKSALHSCVVSNTLHAVVICRCFSFSSNRYENTGFLSSTTRCCHNRWCYQYHTKLKSVHKPSLLLTVQHNYICMSSLRKIKKGPQTENN